MDSQKKTSKSQENGHNKNDEQAGAKKSRVHFPEGQTVKEIVDDEVPHSSHQSNGQKEKKKTSMIKHSETQTSNGALVPAAAEEANNPIHTISPTTSRHSDSLIVIKAHKASKVSHEDRSETASGISVLRAATGEEDDQESYVEEGSTLTQDDQQSGGTRSEVESRVQSLPESVNPSESASNADVVDETEDDDDDAKTETTEQENGGSEVLESSIQSGETVEASGGSMVQIHPNDPSLAKSLSTASSAFGQLSDSAADSETSMQHDMRLAAPIIQPPPDAPFINAISSLQAYLQERSSVDSNSVVGEPEPPLPVVEEPVVEPLPQYPRPEGSCFNRCTQAVNPCCKPDVKPNDPTYLDHVPLELDCRGNNKPHPTYEENMRKKAYLKEVLLNANAQEARSSRQVAEDVTRQYFESHPQTTESVEFLKSRQQFQVAGANVASQIRIPSSEFQNALNGMTNMHLAHEIALNHDFRFEVYNPPGNSLEEQVRTQMKKAYWDIFDEAISSSDPKVPHALCVFREMKEMLLGLLLPHNRNIRVRIETFLDEPAIQYEIDHKTLEFSKYTNFMISILGQLCCPVRDRQVEELRQLVKPSEVFKEIISVMEHMQLDMANFLISQIRPTIINNCVTYERKKFAGFMEIQYKLGLDPLRFTRPWILRHVVDDRPDLVIIGKAFGEILNWTGDWPETIALDFPRYAALAEEVKRLTFLGVAVLSAFETFRGIFGEGDDKLQPYQRGNPYVLRCFPVREVLRHDLSLLIRKEDCVSQETMNHVMDLMAEQCVKCCDEFLNASQQRQMTSDEKNLIRDSVRACRREDHAVRMLLLRRIQEYATAVVAAGKFETITFPKGLSVMQEEVMAVIIELARLTVHNRAVFQDLYIGIAKGEVTAPRFMEDNDGQFDPAMLKAMQLLTAAPTEQLVMTRPARNELLVNDTDADGNLLVQSEDLDYVDTTPELDAKIEELVNSADIHDDYDEFEHLTEEQARNLLKELTNRKNLPGTSKQAKKADALARIEAKKEKLRVELRVQLRTELGLPLFDKDVNTRTTPGLRRYCRLLRAYDAERTGVLLPDTGLTNSRPETAGRDLSEDAQNSFGPDLDDESWRYKNKESKKKSSKK